MTDDINEWLRVIEYAEYTHPVNIPSSEDQQKVKEDVEQRSQSDAFVLGHVIWCRTEEDASYFKLKYWSSWDED